MQIKELLASDKGVRIFSTCTELIRCLPALLRDPKDPCDASTVPHDITHICDAFRYLAMERTRKTSARIGVSWEEEHRKKTIERCRRGAVRR